MAALKALWHKAFKLLIVHAPPCAAVRSRPSADGGRQQRSWGNISPGWSLDGTAPRTGSNVCFYFCRVALFPIPCPAAGQRPGSICRPATGKCSEHRRRTPSHRPATDSFHQCCYSTGVPAPGRAEIGGNRSGVSAYPTNHPLLIWT